MGRALSLALLAIIVAGVLLPAAIAQESPEKRLVTFEGELPLEGSSLAGARVLDTFSFAGVALVEGTPSALTRLSSLPGVAGVYEEEPITLQLDRSRDIVRADAPAPDASWPRGANVTIAVVDSGLDTTHPAFEGRVAASVRVTRGGISSGSGDDDGHGTHIAGILAGNGAGSRDHRQHGLAPEARLVAVDISDSFTTTTAIRAFEWIHENRERHNIRVVSNSWGREKEDAHYDADDPVIRASNALVADGLVVVFSAGNRGRDGGSTLTTEATNPNVLTVGAASASGRVESYSSRGPARDAAGHPLDWVKPDLVAPGTGILSTRTLVKAPAGADEETRHYTVMNGTSMAAPHVAAAAALMIDLDPTLTPGLVAAILTGTARDVSARGADPETGNGMMDVTAALDAVRTLDANAKTVILEREIPIRHEGSTTAIAGQIVLTGGAPHLPPNEQITIPIALPPAATRIDLRFTWTGTGEFAAKLVAADGTTRAFTPDGPRALKLNAQVPPGAYRILAEPEGLAANTPYKLEGAITIREESTVEIPAQFTSRAYSGANSGYFETRTGTRALLDIPTNAYATALLLSVLTLLGTSTWLKRK